MDEVLHDMPDEVRENFKREKVNGAWNSLSTLLICVLVDSYFNYPIAN